MKERLGEREMNEEGMVLWLEWLVEWWSQKCAPVLVYVLVPGVCKYDPMWKNGLSRSLE